MAKAKNYTNYNYNKNKRIPAQKTKSKKEIELAIQIQICKYLSMAYGKVPYSGHGILSSIPLKFESYAKKMKQAGNISGYPDLFIMKPNSQYHGLFIELKAPGVKLYKKNGDPIDERVKNQIEWNTKLNNIGYLAEFCFGFDEAKDCIDNYMKIK